MASTKKSEFETLKREIEKCPGVILNTRLLAPLVISNCNGLGPWPFTCATVDYTLSPAYPICCFQNGIEYIIKHLSDEDRASAAESKENVEQEKAFDCLLNFIKYENHKKCLSSLKEKWRRAERQAILAVHLFAPLVPDSECIIDAKHFPKHAQKCPSCHEKVNVGNTSFGDVRIWHGSADLQVNQSIVKIDDSTNMEKLDEDHFLDGQLNTGNITEDEDAGSSEPSPKRNRYNKSVSTDCDRCIKQFSDDDILSTRSDTSVDVQTLEKLSESQIIAQTIVNAFCTVRKHSYLSTAFIPSFHATDKAITIYMYNCTSDKLLTSEPLMIWNTADPEMFDTSTLVSIWLALNFDKFELEVDLSKTLRIPVSSFQDIVQSKLEVYTTKISRPLLNVEEMDLPVFTMSPDVFRHDLSISNAMSKLHTMYERVKDDHKK